MRELIDKLYKNHNLEKEEFKYLIENFDKDTSEYLFSMAQTTSQEYFQREVYIRGLIEFTNYC